MGLTEPAVVWIAALLIPDKAPHRRSDRAPADREFAYTRGAEKALDGAERDSWTVVSMKTDWSTVC